MGPDRGHSAALSALAGLRHGFFGRTGGVSFGDLASLNVSFSAGDDPANVAENRRRVTAAFSLAPDALVTVKQVHSNRVVSITGPFAEPLPEADAMVTATPGLLLGILTADCTPILFADPEARVIGAAHAGWKGAIGDIMAETVAAMVQFGARRDRIAAAIGPTISGPNYEVGPDFARDCLALAPDAAPFLSTPPGGREHFDLPGFVAHRLRASGIGKIDDLALCTYADPGRFFSHRFATHRGTGAGRQISVIGLI